MIRDIINNEICCGCSSCYHSCRSDAITMQENSKGFLNAKINMEKCINCGICDKVCPVKHQDINKNIKCYALRLHDNNQRRNSQSGGAFYCIAKSFILSGGVVYGVSNTDGRNVSALRVDSIEELAALQKSKYVQSDCTSSFPLVKEDLLGGKRVFYSGTACVVQGLKNYLKQEKVCQDQLFTCDLICHGVPSRLIDRDYIDYVEKKENSKVISIIYRNKERGWCSHFEKYTLESGKVSQTNDKVIVFSKGYALSPACFNCKFTTPYRDADITIGDFWSFGKLGMSKQQFIDCLSVCIVRNDYIEEIIDKLTLSKEVEITEIELTDAMQWNLEKPSVKPLKYEQFWRMYSKNRFKNLCPLYFTLSNKEKIARIARRILKK